MTFLQPILLAALPLVALPILIHLLNRRRHRTVAWAAMMFLLDAQRLTRGMARLRFWLIMAMRMLAIAGLIFAVARPLASGWMALAAGGQPDTTIVLLDRSVSMEQQDLQSGQSKRSTALAKIADLLRTLGGAGELVLIESTVVRPQRIDALDMLLDLPEAGPTASSADIPAMLQAALEYSVANRSGRTDLWILSDLRAADWNPDDGRWASIRDGFSALDGVRLYLLVYPELPADNLAVWASDVRRRTLGDAAELVLDIGLARSDAADGPTTVPLEITLDGARSVVEVEVHERETLMQGHTIGLDAAATRGWGSIALPSDGNPQDNVFYFAFADPPERQAVIVSDDRQTAELLRVAAVSPLDAALSYSASVLPADRAWEIDWDTASMILWQAPLPAGPLAVELEQFAASGRPIIFLPPLDASAEAGGELFGVRWGRWLDAVDQPMRVASWRGDSDLLQHSRSGQPLPLNRLETRRAREIDGAGTALARLDAALPLVARPAAGSDPVYFLATLPGAEHSSLAQDGVAFYALIQRALAAGAESQSAARHVAAGSLAAREVADWDLLSDMPPGTTASERAFQAGVFREPGGERLVALNWPRAEVSPQIVDDAALAQLLDGLDYRKIEDRVGSQASLASEIWRLFLVAMAVALLVEASLCMPQRRAAVSLDTR